MLPSEEAQDGPVPPGPCERDCHITRVAYDSRHAFIKDAGQGDLLEGEGSLSLSRRMLDVNADHVKTNPADTPMARSDYDACGKEASDSGRRFAWYENSVDQGHPDRSWLPFR